MRAGNAVESLASALYGAVNNPNYLPDFKYQHTTWQDRRDGKPGVESLRRLRADELSCYHFPQMWGSTALGFGGIGGAAMSEAYTTVIVDPAFNAAVFFDGRYAYTVKMCDNLQEDVAKHVVVGVSSALKRYAK